MADPLTPERIRQRLQVLTPTDLDLQDDSARHAGHAGAASGGGHYQLQMTSASFAGLSRVARHRLVYDSLGDLMQREVHALTMTLLAPGEGSAGTASPPFPREGT